MRAIMSFALLLGVALPAQSVTVHAIAVAELRVQANTNIQTIPANTVVSSGYSLSAQYTGQRVWSTASTTLTVKNQPGRVSVEMRERAYGANSWTAQGSASFGPHHIRLVFSCPAPTDMTLRIEKCTHATTYSGAYSGSIDVVGHQRVVASPSSLPCVFTERDVSLIPVTVDNRGLILEIRTQGSGKGLSSMVPSGEGNGRWLVELEPRDWTVASYGSGCGADLDAGPAAGASHLLDLRMDDISQPTAAWLLVGTQRVSVPFPGCNLLTNTLVILPWKVDSSGHSSLLLDPRLFPGVSVTVQGVTAGTSGVRLTKGLAIDF